ncbi:MAG: ribokinase [Clostridia bacterium]|nr:ribokinase [Clostridia bacterium]
MKVLNFGSMNLDYVYQVDHFVQEGETLSALSQTVKAGGKGLNQSIALARAGAEVWHAGCVGQGGAMLRELLRESGVHDDYLCSVDTLQGNAMIQVNRTGENCILLFGGSNQCMTETQIDEALSHFSAGDWLVLQNEINLVPLMIEKASARGMRIVLNPSPYNDRLAEADFGKLSWIFVNEIEAEQLTGCKDPAAAWQMIHVRWPKLSLLITLGSAGCMAWLVTENGVLSAAQPAFPVKAVDTTAAGDTFTGYFITCLMEGMQLQESLRLAARASAFAVTRAGAAESIPTRGEVEQERDCIQGRESFCFG